MYKKSLLFNLSVLFLLVAFSLRADWIQHDRVGDRIYFLDDDPGRVAVFELSSGSFLSDVALTKTPVAFDVDDSAILVAFSDQTVHLFDLNGTQLHAFAGFGGEVRNVFLRSQEVGVDFVENWSNGRVQVFDRSTFVLESSSYSSKPSYARSLSLSESEERFVVSDTWERFTSRTLLATANSNPANPDYLANPLLTDSFYGYTVTDVVGWSRMFPDGERFITQAGLIYRVNDCAFSGSAGGVIDDVAFTSTGEIVLLRGDRLFRLSGDLAPLGEFALSETASSIAVEGTTVTVFRSDSNEVSGIGTNTVDLGQFVPETITTPAPPDPYGVSFTPGEAFSDTNGVLYVLHAPERTLYRWNPDTGDWLDPIRLWGSPTHLRYDRSSNRVYLSYTYRVNVLRLDLGETEERFFAFTPGLSQGLQLAGGWLYLHTDLNSDGNVRVFDLATGLPVNAGASVNLSWLYRDEGTSYLYALQGTYGRMYRYVVEADGTIGSRVKIATDDFEEPLLFPDGESLLTPSGNVFGVPDFTMKGDPVLPYETEDAQWSADTLYSLSAEESGSLLSTWSEGLEAGWNQLLEGEPLHVAQGGGWVHAITLVEGQPLISSFGIDGTAGPQTEVNRAPTAIHFDGDMVSLEMSPGDAVGEVQVVDPNMPDTHVLSLIVNEGGLFELDGNILRLAVQPPDLDQPDFKTVTLRAEDPFGQTVESSFLIDIQTPGNQTAPPIQSPGLLIWRASKVQRAGDIIFILDYARPYVHRWDLAGRAYLDPIPLRGVGVGLSVIPETNKLYVSYPLRSMTEIDLNDPGFTESMWGKVQKWGSKIIRAGDRYLEIPDGESTGYWYDENGGALGEFSHYWVADDDYLWSEDRLYSLRSGRVVRFRFDGDYQMLPDPLSRSGLGRSMVMHGDADRLLENTGNILDADDLTILGRAGDESYRSVDWFGDEILTLSTGGLLSRWSAGLEVQRQYSLPYSSSALSAAKVWGAGEEAVVLTWPDGQPRFRYFDAEMNVLFTSPVNLPPEEINPASVEMPESLSIGDSVTLFTITDPFPGITHMLEILASSDPHPFVIDGLELKLAAEVDYFEDPRSYALDLLCTDRFGETLEQSVTVAVTHVPEPPADLVLTQDVLVEGDPAGTSAATLSVIDRDPDTTHMYELVDNPDGLFALAGDQLSLASDLPLTGATTLSISVRATNSHGLSRTESLALDVFSLPDPVLTTLPASGVDENIFIEGQIFSDHGISMLEWFLNGNGMGELSLVDEFFSLDAPVDLEGENTIRFLVTDPWQRTVDTQTSMIWTPERILELTPLPTPREGQSFQVPLQLHQTGDIGSLEFKISYDPQWFQEPSFSFNTGLPTLLSDVIVDAEAGTVRGTLAWIFSPPAGQTLLGHLSLRARSVPGETENEVHTTLVEIADAFGSAYSYGNHGRTSSLTVLPRQITGDTNGNGEVDIADVTTLQRLLMGLEEMRTWDVGLNDLNGDGLFTISDMSWAFRVVLGLRSQPATEAPMEAAMAMAGEMPLPSEPASFDLPAGPALTFTAPRLVGPEEGVWTCWVEVRNPPAGLSSLSFRLHYPTGALQPVSEGVSVQTEGMPNVLKGHHLVEADPPSGSLVFAASGLEAWDGLDPVRVGFRFEVRPEAGPHDWLLRIRNARAGRVGGDLVPLPDVLGVFSTREIAVEGYQTWATRNIWPYTDRIGPRERPFEGEAVNLMRYAMGFSALDRVEGGWIQSLPDGLSFERNRHATDVRYQLQKSTDLVKWEAVPASAWIEQRIPLTSDRERVEWRVPDPDPGKGVPIFYRLRVEGTP